MQVLFMCVLCDKINWVFHRKAEKSVLTVFRPVNARCCRYCYNTGLLLIVFDEQKSAVHVPADYCGPLDIIYCFVKNRREAKPLSPTSCNNLNSNNLNKRIKGEKNEKSTVNSIVTRAAHVHSRRITGGRRRG